MIEKWNQETCFKAAKTCTNITEFRENFSGAYYKSQKKGWLKQYTWFIDGKRDVHKKTYTVYAYEDSENKKVYVGLTNNLKRRIMEHKKKDYKHSCRTYDRVREYFENHNKTIPEPIVLISGIDGIEAQEKERYYIEEYQQNGWSVLNLSKTGQGTSSLGNVGVKSPWTREACVELSKKFKNRKTLEREYPTAYNSILNNHWDDILPVKKVLTKDECKEICKNMENINELKEENIDVYKRVKSKGWIHEMFPISYYDEEECREKALKYSTKKEACQNDPLLIQSIKKLGLDDIVFHKKGKYEDLTFEEVKMECSKYIYRTDLLRKDYELYNLCKKKEWLDDVLPIKRFVWDIENALLEAKKYDGRNAFRTAHFQAHRLLKEHGLLDVVFPKYKQRPKKEKQKTNTEKHPHIPPLSKDDCFNAALNCEYKREFREKYPKEYYYSSTFYKCLKEYTWLKGCKRVITEDECLNAAKKCSTKKEFRENFPQEYTFSRENGMIKGFWWLKHQRRG